MPPRHPLSKIWLISDARNDAVLDQALQRLPKAEIETALRTASRLDRLVKGIGKGDIWEEFLRLGLSLSPQK